MTKKRCSALVLLAALAVPALAQQQLCKLPVNGVLQPVAPGSPGNPGVTPPLFGARQCTAAGMTRTVAEFADMCYTSTLCGPGAPGHCGYTFHMINADNFECLAPGGGSQIFGGTCTTPTQTWLTQNPTKGCPPGSHRDGNSCERDDVDGQNAGFVEDGYTVNRNSDGNITSVSKSGLSWAANSFDAQKRVTQATNASGRVVTYTYGSSTGVRVATKTVASGVTATYAYNADGTIDTITMSDTGFQYKLTYRTDAGDSFAPKKIFGVQVITGDGSVSGQPVQCGVPVEDQVAALSPVFRTKYAANRFSKGMQMYNTLPGVSPHVRVAPDGNQVVIEYVPTDGENVDLLNPFESVPEAAPVDVCMMGAPAGNCFLCHQGCDINPGKGFYPSWSPSSDYRGLGINSNKALCHAMCQINYCR